jgi:hypothetical protein
LERWEDRAASEFTAEILVIVIVLVLVLELGD